jgi:hypothetical protein
MLKILYSLFAFALIAVSPASAQDPAAPASPAPAAPPASAAPPPAAAKPEPVQSAAPEGAGSYFVNLHNGQKVTSPFKVVFGLKPNMGVAPSGVEKANVGHHHILVDTTLKPEEVSQPIVVDEQHIHFGKGQTETMLTLPPGKHTLQLVLGDWTHVPFKPSVQSEVITVRVRASKNNKEKVAAEPRSHQH